MREIQKFLFRFFEMEKLIFYGYIHLFIIKKKIYKN